MSGDWSVLGFSDDPVRGDPGAARTAGQESQREAQRWEEQARSLRAVASEGGALPMEGDFAPAARQRLQGHPDEVSALVRARDEAGRALVTYAEQLAQAKRQSQMALNQGTQAKRSYDMAKQRYDQLEVQMRALPRTPTAAEYPAVMVRYNDLNVQMQRAWGQMEQANGQLRDAQQRASQAGQQAAQHERAAANRVRSAIGGRGGRADVGIADYTGSAHGRLNAGLRSGNLTSEEKRLVDKINADLDPLPNYVGPVYRGTYLKPDDLARYKPGSVVQDQHFTSTSTIPGRYGDRPVQFVIDSRTGKNVTEQSSSTAIEQEVLFRNGTSFRVLDRWVDPKTGQTVIKMEELPPT